MTVVSFINRKGGAGKTTLVCLCALYWSQQGRRVLVIDRDPQGSAAAFARNAEDPNIITEQSDDADFVLVDTPGGIPDRDTLQLLEQSDLVLIPFRLGPTDMNATGKTVRIFPDGVQNVRLLFNQVKTSTAVFKNRKSYADLLGIPPLKTHLSDRVAYQYAVNDGWGMLDKRAKDELAALATEIESEAE